MREKLRARLSPPMVVALLALFVATAGTTWAGNGDTFILGSQNGASKTTTLTSTSSGAGLQVGNTGTGPGLKATSKSSNGITGETQAPNLAGVYALNDGTSAGDGLHAVSIHGNGVDAQGANAGGTFSGGSSGDGVQGAASATGKSGVYAHHDGTNFGYGVFAKSLNGYGVSGTGSSAGGTFSGSTTGDGAQGVAAATGRSGLWGHHDGSNFGYGVFAQSATGPAIGMLGNANSAPVTLNGNPFPNAVAGYKNSQISVPDGSTTPVATLSGIPAGTYIIIAGLQVNVGGNSITCTLTAGADQDQKYDGGTPASSMTLLVFHKFTSTGSASLACGANGSGSNVVFATKIVAIQVGGGTNNALP